MDEVRYYFGFRVLRPPGAWFVHGPYSTRDEAKREREKAKAWDAEVTTFFIAGSAEEAKERCNTGQTF